MRRQLFPEPDIPTRMTLNWASSDLEILFRFDIRVVYYFLLSCLYLMSRGRPQGKKAAFNAKDY